MSDPILAEESDDTPLSDPCMHTWALERLSSEERSRIAAVAHDEEAWRDYIRMTRRERWSVVTVILARYWRGVCLVRRLRAEMGRTDARRLEDES